MVRNRTKIRVRYADTDAMKFVYYGKYFEYFEQGRSELLRDIGMPYTEIEKQGILIAVVEAYAKYRKSARYDDLLIVETTCSEVPVARIRIEYRIMLEGETEPLVEGYTVHSFLNESTGRPTRAPAQFLQIMQEAMNKTRE
ncbi:MAG TPA: thioesterase family protein [Bacteroidota bacterium]|nr:thioesterase family protein [Bacteroidota bacterium]